MATATIITLAQFNQAQEIVDKVLGTGSNDYGYGQTLQSSQLVSEVTGEELNKLRTDILIAAYHQKGPSASTLIPAIATNSGGTINYTINALNSQAIVAATIGVAGKLGTIDAGRFGFYSAGVGAKVNTTELYTDTLTTDDWNSTTTHVVTIQFASADAMRWYFNTGSSVQIMPSRTGGTTSAKNTSWATVLNVGTITFNRTGTLSSKSTTTTAGLGFNKLTTTDQTIFTKSSTGKSEVYTIKAKLDGTDSIVFTTTFSNVGANVTGTLKNNFKVFYADRPVSEVDTNEYVQVAPPTYDEATSHVEVGLATPTFTLIKNPIGSSLSETGRNTTVSYTIQTSNYLDTYIYYNIVKITSTNTTSIIEDSDFVDVPLSGSLVVTPTTGTGGVSDVLAIVVNADLKSEGPNKTAGIDRFTVEFRATDNVADPLLPIFVGVITINDTSLTPPTPTPSIRFAALPVGKAAASVMEGDTITFDIIAKNIPETNRMVTYKIQGTGANKADIKSSDFIGLEADATFELSSDNTYSLSLEIADDSSVLDSSGNKIYEKQESFTVELFLTNPITNKPNTRADASSYLVLIGPDPLPVVPYEIIPVVQETIEGNKTTGIEATIKTPFLAKGKNKVWYQIYPASTTNEITGADFTDGKLSGFVDIVVKGNSGLGKFRKYAVSDKFTEGREGFYVDFFEDENQTTKINTSVLYFYVNENIPYVATRSAPTMWETSDSTTKLTQITFTLTTPAMTETTSVHWEVMAVPGFGTITEDDFEEKVISGDKDIENNKIEVILTGRDDGLTEGTEQFFVRFTYPFGTGTAYKDTPVASLSESVGFSIEPQDGVTTMEEALAANATGITFDIKTPWLAKNTPINWEAKSTNPSYKILPSDFKEGKVSGVITVNPTTITNTAILKLSAIIDPDVEGNEGFYVVLKQGNTIVARSPDITITEDVKYKVYPAASQVTEGGTAIKINITTPKVPDGTKVPWVINPTTDGITADDFLVLDNQSKVPESRLSGYVLTTGNRASFQIAARSDAIANSSAGTELDESFKITINPDEPDKLDETISLAVRDVSPYIISTDVKTVKETDDNAIIVAATTRTVNFTIYTPYLKTGTLYFTVKTVTGTVNANDFDSVSQTTISNGSFTVTDSVGIISLTMADDKIKEGNDAFVIEIREGSKTGTIVKNGTSPNILIYDNSQQGEVVPPPAGAVVLATVPPNRMQVIEGNNITFRITTTNVSDTESFVWDIFSLAINEISGDISPVGSSGVFNVTGGTKDITIQANTDIYNEVGGEVFIFQLHRGSIATRDNIVARLPMTVVDPTPYKISTNNKIFRESGQLGAIFSVTTPAEAYTTTMKFTVVPSGTSTLTGDDFVLSTSDHPGYTFDPNTLTGTVLINNQGNGEFALYPKNDGSVESAESFYVTLKKQTGQGTWEASAIPGVQSDVIQIVDNTGYDLIPQVGGVPLVAPYEITAGTTITYVLSTPVQTKVAAWTWTLLGVDLAPYMNYTGTINLTTVSTSYSFNVITKDTITSKKTLKVQLKNAAGIQQTVSGNPDVSVIVSERYAITPKVNGQLVSEITENTTLTFDVISNTSPIHWYLVTDSGNPVDATDFATPQPLSGTLYPKSAVASIKLPFTTRKTKAGTKQFHVILSKTAPTPQGDIPEAVTGGTSAVVSKTESATYGITADNTNVAEGTGVTFNVTTPYTATDQLYSYTVVASNITSVTPSGAFVTSTGNLTGTFKIASPGAGSFTLTVPNDSVANTRTYKVQIKDQSLATVIANSAANNPEITVTSSTSFSIVASASVSNSSPVTSVMEGNSITFTMTQSGSPAVTSLKWTAIAADGNSTFVASHLSGSIVTNTTKTNALGKFQVTITTTKDNPITRGNNTNRTFKLELRDGVTNNLLATSSNPTITITDFDFMSVTDNGLPAAPAVSPSVNETGAGNSITFTVTTLSTDNTHPLTWALVNTTTNVVPANLGLSTTTGDTGVVSDGQVTFTVTLAADNTTNKTAKAFAIKFTSKVDITKTVTTRTVAIVDKSFTPPAEYYAVEDTALPALPSKIPTIDENGTNNTVTFTVTTKTGEAGPLYWRIKASSGSAILKEHFTAITGADVTGLSGTTTITNKTATLAVTAFADKSVVKLPKGFYVEFSLTAFTSTTKIATGLTSRTIKINDTALPDPYVPNCTMEVTYQPLEITSIGTKFQIECKISPLLNRVSLSPVKWKVNSTNVNISAVLRKFSAPTTALVYPVSETAFPKDRNNVNAPSDTLFCVLDLTVIADAKDPCGPFSITFEISDPLSPTNKISVTSGQIFLNHVPVTVPIPYKTTVTKWTVPPEVYKVDVELKGAGGTGGGASLATATAGYEGGSGDKVVTTVYVIPGQVLNISYVAGGTGGTGTSMIGSGGAGGTGVVLTDAKNIVLAVASGGGGGDGAGYTGGADGSSPNPEVSIPSVAPGASSKVVGQGGAGGAGGLLRLSGGSNGGITYTPPGTSPMYGGGGTGGTAGTVTVTTKTYHRMYPDFISEYDFINNYGLNAANETGVKTLTATWNAVSIPAGTYTLFYSLDDSGSITINDVKYALAFGAGVDHKTDVVIPATWNRTIIATVTNAGGPWAIGATLRPKGTADTPSNYVWNTTMPATIHTVVAPIAVNINASASISYTKSCDAKENRLFDLRTSGPSTTSVTPKATGGEGVWGTWMAGHATTFSGTQIWNVVFPETRYYRFRIGTDQSGSIWLDGTVVLNSSSFSYGSGIDTYINVTKGTHAVSCKYTGDGNGADAMSAVISWFTTEAPTYWFRSVAGVYTLPVPSGMVSARINCIAAGGGSGSGIDSGTSNGQSGGGGGAGGVSYALVSVTAGDVLTITVGKGGLGGDKTLYPANDYNRYGYYGKATSGGNSTVIRNGTTLVQATGGLPGDPGYIGKSGEIPFVAFGGHGGEGNVRNGSQGGSGTIDPAGGTSTCPAANGGTNLTAYGNGASSQAAPDNGKLYVGKAGQDGYVAVTWVAG